MDTDDYRWFEFVDRPIPERFPRDWPWLAGAEEWAEGARGLPEVLSVIAVITWLQLSSPISIRAAVKIDICSGVAARPSKAASCRGAEARSRISSQ
jgi:hypothetical protein